MCTRGPTGLRAVTFRAGLEHGIADWLMPYYGIADGLVPNSWVDVTCHSVEKNGFASRTFLHNVLLLSVNPQDAKRGEGAVETVVLVSSDDEERLTLAASIGPHVLRDLGMNLISFAGSDAAAVLLVAALSSVGILGTSVAAGTAGGPLTFGISLVAGLIAGIALDALVGDVYEDAARMEVRRHMNGVRNQMIDGVHDALVKALVAYRTLEERCVVALYEGGSYERLDRRP